MVEMVESQGKMTKTNYIHGVFTLLLIIVYSILHIEYYTYYIGI